MKQLSLFGVKPTANRSSSRTRHIVPKFRFEPSPEPIQLPHFCEEMLLVQRDDPIVFKQCDCGAVYGFNSDSAYHSCLIVCYRCQRKMWARQMAYIPQLKKIFTGDQIFDWATCELYRWGEGNSFGSTIQEERSAS